jgi:hypothetical protein
MKRKHRLYRLRVVGNRLMLQADFERLHKHMRPPLGFCRRRRLAKVSTSAPLATKARLIARCTGPRPLDGASGRLRRFGGMAIIQRARGNRLLVRRTDGNPSVRLTLSTVVVTELSRNPITPLVEDPQINVWCEFVDDLDINFSIAHTVPKHVIGGFTYFPKIGPTETQRVDWYSPSSWFLDR